MDTIRLTFFSLSGRLLALFTLIGSALRFKGKVYSRFDWLFAFGARPGVTELGGALFGFDLFLGRWYFAVELAAFYRNFKFCGTPRRPRTWRLRIARG